MDDEAEYCPRVERVVNPGTRRTYVRDHKANEEKRQRAQRKAAAKRKRNDTLMRKAEPQTKRSKMEKKSKRIQKKKRNVTRVYSDLDVETRHKEIENTFLMQSEDRLPAPREWYYTYIKNFRDWSDVKARKVCDAALEDTRYENKLKVDKEKEAKERIKNAHKSKMSGCLSLISDDFGSASKIAKPRPQTLSGFFKKSAGFNKNKVKRFYNSLYFSIIVGSTIRVHNMPQLETDEPLSDEEQEKEGEFKCDSCSGAMIIDHKMGQLSCSSCGLVKQGGYGVGLKQTFSESQASTRSPAPYDRLSHVSFNPLTNPSSYPLLKAIHFSCSILPSVISTTSPPSGGQGFALSGLGRIFMVQQYTNIFSRVFCF